MDKFFLPETSTVKNMEKSFEQYFKRMPMSGKQAIDVDFRNVRFFEPSMSSAYLIGLLNTLKSNGHTFKITPPNNNGIKIILYTWRFFEVLEETTDIPVSEFCPALEKDFEEGKHFRVSSLREKVVKYYQDINKSNYKDYFTKRYVDETSLSLLTTSERFFPLLSLNFSSEETKYEEFENEKSRWKNVSLINGILANNLKNIDVKRKITDDVIGEAISNAIMHSDANKFFIGSFFDFKNDNPDTTILKKTDPNKTYNFTINFYDNGQSILDTLRSSVDGGFEIRSSASELAFQKKTDVANMTFLIKRDGYDYKLVDTAHELNKNSPNHEFLLGAFFPGVSSKINRPGNNSESSLAGLGLSFLVNSVVYELGGEIAVRTGNYFLNIRKAKNTELDSVLNEKFGRDSKPSKKEYFKENFYYTAKFEPIDENMLEFCGNLVTARIPLKYKQFNATT